VSTPAANGWILTVLGAFLLLGFLANEVGRRAHVPRVTLLLLLGFGAGALDLIADELASWFPLVARVALSLVGFILGERFFGSRRAGYGRVIVLTSVAESLVAAGVVLALLWAVGVPLPLALLLAGIAPATAPAATLDVIREARAEGPVTDTTIGIVALDDAYCVILFSLFLVAAQGISGEQTAWSVVGLSLWEVFGAVGLGLALGLPMAWLTGRVRPGELSLLEALGFVLLCGGIASLLDVSYVLASMTLGGVVARRAQHHTRPLHAIEGISQPFLVLFFLLAGFEFELEVFGRLSFVAVGYVGARTLGKVLGGYLGARVAAAPAVVQAHVGWCLLPQAGVALGLALVAAERIPRLGGELLTVLVGTTFIFEIVGPIATKLALRSAREVSA
jgi:Kef-type K+ transport system membrane component KefB